MLLTSQNLSEMKLKTKQFTLQTAEAEINVRLLTSAEIEDLKLVRDIIMAAVVDNNGKPVFENAEAFDSLALAVQKEIMDNVWDYNCLKRESIEEIKKN